MGVTCAALLMMRLWQAGDGADRTFEHVFEYLPLEVPSARTIRKLAAFDGKWQCGNCGRLGMLGGCRQVVHRENIIINANKQHGQYIQCWYPT
jgi:hypothetical protein